MSDQDKKQKEYERQNIYRKDYEEEGEEFPPDELIPDAL